MIPYEITLNIMLEYITLCLIKWESYDFMLYCILLCCIFQNFINLFEVLNAIVY